MLIYLGGIHSKENINKFQHAQVMECLFTKITFAVALVSFLCYSTGSATLHCRKREKRVSVKHRNFHLPVKERGN